MFSFSFLDCNAQMRLLSAELLTCHYWGASPRLALSTMIYLVSFLGLICGAITVSGRGIGMYFVFQIIEIHVTDENTTTYINGKLNERRIQNKGIQNSLTFSIAQKQVITLFSVHLQITGQPGSNLLQLRWWPNMWTQLAHLYSWGDEPCLINANSLWICVLHIRWCHQDDSFFLKSTLDNFRFSSFSFQIFRELLLLWQTIKYM